jgi:hypothetical protein
LGRFIGIIIEWVLIALILFAFFIRTSPVQTFLAQKATDFLSTELNTTIHVDRLAIVFIDRVALDGVLVLDQKNDTLAYIKTLYVTLDELNLKKNFVKLDKAELDQGTIHINRDKKTEDFNFWFITDYFASDKKPSGKEPIAISLNTLKLTDVNFKYDDYRKYYSTFGMDYDHIDLKHIFLSANDFHSDNGILSAYISELRAEEKCGFILSEFSAQASISKRGLFIDKLLVKTPQSDINIPKLHFKMNGLDDFKHFIDSVEFDAKLCNSTVSLKDVSYFATALEGMDQMCYLSGNVTNKVKNLKISDLNFKTGKRTILQGTINLPDFRVFKSSFFNEKIDYAYVSLNDLKKIKMPVDAKQRYLTFDKYLERLGNFQTKDLRLDGFYSQFVVAADYLKTDLGTVKMDNGVMFTENPLNKSYFFERSAASKYDVKIEKFQLGKFLNDSNFGVVDGTFFLSGEAFSLADIHFNLIEGNLNRFDYMDYSYQDIFIEKGSFADKKFIAKIDVRDDNLNLAYDGFIDFNGNQHMSFNIDLTKALLANLGITQEDSTSLTSNFSIDVFGKTTNSMTGSITMNGMLYKEGSREIQIPSLTVNVTRGKVEDKFTIKSHLADAELIGKIDFTTLIDDFMDQFNKVFPSIIQDKKTKKKKKQKSPSNFIYSVEVHEANDFLAIFAPDLKINTGTILKGSYDGRTENFSMNLTSDKIMYQQMSFEGIVLDQKLTSSEITADYSVQKFNYNDSISLDHVHFITTGKQNQLSSEISWNPNSTNESLIVWETIIIDSKNLNFTLKPSYFSINEMRWEIENQSDFSLSENEIHIAKFKLERNKQYISLDGCISRNDADKLNFKVNDLNLSELASFVGADMKMEGMVNGWGYISNPYTNLTYIGDAAIQGLYLNDQEVGDIFVQTEWNKASESVGLLGDLIYRGNQTFKFDGSYFTAREKDNLDFNLVFDQTDIQFTNAFMDPDVVNNIRGVIDGSLKVSGTPDFPILEGEIELISGNAKLDLLGVNFGFDGKISADQYGFYIDNMPVSDEEGNMGSLIGSVYHEKYQDWNFDLQFDLEPSTFYRNTPFFTAQAVPLEKFLILNTQYKEGDIYYGKAYVTGTANIFGYADNLEITVDVQTKKGTTINFPMYGVAELDEEESFITFKKKGDKASNIQPKIDFTGVDLDLNFRVTPDAKLKIIFNEQTGDEISASGSGDIAIKMDNLGDVSMDGTYRVKEGLYNFAMGSVIKQPFHIEEGGTIAWTGDPVNATLDLKTYYEVNANLSEISPDQLQGTGKGSNQKVLCYLGLTESLMKPTIDFDIKAPKADENGKALLARITGDPDELNRQFFSLLLWKRFQPLRGSTAAGGSAAMDLVSNQINSMLSQVSKDYKMNVNLDADAVTGEKAYEFGLSKGFLDDRLILTGSFGVESTSKDQTQQGQNALIGDVSLEYLLNESGTVRVNVFNESNDYSIIQDKNLGLFTQGAGLHYQEDFDHFDNFKLAQYFLDIFRKKSNKRYPVKRKKKQTPVPPIKDNSMLFILPDDKLKISGIFFLKSDFI